MGQALAAAAAVGAGLLTAYAWWDARRKTHRPELQYAPTEFNARVISACPSMHEDYRPLPFLTNGHVETIFAAKTRAQPPVAYTRELLPTADGGCVALDWEAGGKSLPEDAPTLLLLPGLTGGSGDSYVRYAVRSAAGAGMRAVVFNSRGTADSPVVTPQFYSASFTGDMRAVVAHVSARYPAAPLLAAGWSLGANILLNYCGEEAAAGRAPLAAAVSLCNPFDLTISNAGLQRGFSRIYDANLASALRTIFAKHAHVWAAAPPPFRPADVPTADTIRAFDEAITIHSFGWATVEDYYAGSSSARAVPRLNVPTLCIQAADDPIAPLAATPVAALAANPLTTLLVTATGGHLGWVAGEGAPFGAPWTDKVVLEWLTAVLAELREQREQGQGEDESAVSLVTAPLPVVAAAVQASSRA